MLDIVYLLESLKVVAYALAVWRVFRIALAVNGFRYEFSHLLVIENKTVFKNDMRAGLDKLDKDYNTSTKWREYASWGVMTLPKKQCIMNIFLCIRLFSLGFIIPGILQIRLHNLPSNKAFCHFLSTKQNLAHMLNSYPLKS
jgi:hypothetical protein